MGWCALLEHGKLVNAEDEKGLVELQARVQNARANGLGLHTRVLKHECSRGRATVSLGVGHASSALRTGGIANVLRHISANTWSTRMGNLSASSVGIHGDGSKSNERGLSAQPAHSDAERAGRERSALPYDCARTQLE